MNDKEINNYLNSKEFFMYCALKQLRSMKAKSFIPYFIKDNIHDFLKKSKRNTPIYYNNIEFFITRQALFIKVDGLYIITLNDNIIKIPETMKYKSKNKYIKGYNKN